MKKQLVIFIFMFTLVKINNLKAESELESNLELGEIFKYVVHQEILDKNVPEFKKFRQKYRELFALLATKVSDQDKQNAIDKLVDFSNSIIENQNERLASDANLTLSQKASIKYVVDFITSKLEKISQA